MEAASLKHDEKLFDLKAECVTLDVILNRPEEWEITARDSEQVCCLGNLLVVQDIRQQGK